MKTKKMMSVNNKVLLIIILAFVAILSSFVWNQKDRDKSSVTRVALCPTYYIMENALISDGYSVLKTKSTSESLEFLSKGEVDYVIAGRVQMPGENFNFQIIDRDASYSFMADQSMSLSMADLSTYKVFTDQPIEDLQKVFNGIEYEQVHDVYNYLDQGIVITSWENTDYSKGSVVHIFLEDESRNPNSRIPVVYSSIDSEIEQRLINLVKYNYK